MGVRLCVVCALGDEGGLAVEQAIKASSLKDPEAAYQAYIEAAAGKSNSEAREIAKDILGESVYWNWDCKHSLLVARHVGIHEVRSSAQD